MYIPNGYIVPTKVCICLYLCTKAIPRRTQMHLNERLLMLKLLDKSIDIYPKQCYVKTIG